MRNFTIVNSLVKKLSIVIFVLLAACSLFACANKDIDEVKNETKYVEDRIHGNLLKVGEKLPDISVKTNQGNVFDSSKTTKPIVINCWATW